MEKSNAVENEVMNIDELSRYLKVTKSTIYFWVSKRSIPHIKVGRLVRFNKPEIDAWIEQKKKPAREVNADKILNA